MRVAGLCKGWSHDVMVIWFTHHRHVTIMMYTKTGRGERGGVGEREERERICHHHVGCGIAPSCRRQTV